MGDYAVGRGKPPVNTRFKPGESGNPSGRPRHVPTLKSELIAELGELVPGAGGEPVSKQRVVVRTLLKAALGGNLRAIGVIIAVLGRSRDQEGEPEDLTDYDREILNGLAEREGETSESTPRVEEQK